MPLHDPDFKNTIFWPITLVQRHGPQSVSDCRSNGGNKIKIREVPVPRKAQKMPKYGPGADLRKTGIAKTASKTLRISVSKMLRIAMQQYLYEPSKRP